MTMMKRVDRQQNAKVEPCQLPLAKKHTTKNNSNIFAKEYRRMIQPTIALR
jgi:hypothetical protein